MTPRQLQTQPITLKEACRFIGQHHAHHSPPRGWRFGVAITEGGTVVAVAIAGRPVARHIQQQEPATIEVTRCCTDRTPNAASMAYAAIWRAARALGYDRAITYTLETEAGTCLKAAGWRPVRNTKGGNWSCPSRPRSTSSPTGPKRLWEISRDRP